MEIVINDEKVPITDRGAFNVVKKLMLAQAESAMDELWERGTLPHDEGDTISITFRFPFTVTIRGRQIQEAVDA